MVELYITLAVIGAVVLFLGLFSSFIKQRTILSEPLLALLAGVTLGPLGTGLLDPERWGNQHTILEEVVRLTIAIGVMGIALRLPPAYPFKNWRSMGVALGLVMPLMWLSSGILVYLLLGVSFWSAMLIGAIVAPTDPIVATSIVTGNVAERNLPARLRHIISAESGANDGLAYPLVLLAILMINRAPGEALQHWLSRVLLWEVLAALAVGALIGFMAGRLLTWAEARQSIESPSFLSYTLALTLLTLGVCKIINTDGILGVFVAGILFDMEVGGKERAEEQGIQEAISQFFTRPVFVLLGLMLPINEWLALGWRGLAVAAAILAVRRLPFVLAIRPIWPALKQRDDAWFVGWFGPIGIAALFYAMLALRHTGDITAWAFTSLIVCGSILVHGVTSTPLAKRYGRRQQTQENEETQGASSAGFRV